MLSGEMARVFNVPPPGVGMLIERVAAGSPADLLGLKGGITRASIGDEEIIVGGDIILSILGVSFAEPNSLGTIRQKITGLNATDQVAVVVLRGGKLVTLTTQAPAQP
jgi:S1-C subfamily serine protease